MKNKPLIITGIIILISFLLILAIPKPQNQQEFETEILAQNLDTPWAMDFLPSDRIIFTERGGDVSIIDNKTIINVGNINSNEISESGLLGIAVDPEFNTNKFIYVYYTGPDGNRISRFTLNEKLENETIILDGIPSAQIHNGGRLKFGPDGKLYATSGDAGEPSLAQDTSSLAGKILRLNKDGSIPLDNPFNNYVYSYGHRNPQGITWNPVTREMYSSEHGQTRNDEINVIVKGGNYGWPIYQGSDSAEGFIKPLIFYQDFTLAPSGIAYHKGSLYVAGLRGSQLRKITLGSDGNTVTGQEEIFSDLGRIREVVEHNGYLYISTSNMDGRGIPKAADDKIIRIKVP